MIIAEYSSGKMLLNNEHLEKLTPICLRMIFHPGLQLSIPIFKFNLDLQLFSQAALPYSSVNNSLECVF